MDAHKFETEHLPYLLGNRRRMRVIMKRMVKVLNLSGQGKPELAPLDDLAECLRNLTTLRKEFEARMKVMRVMDARASQVTSGDKNIGA